MKKNVKIIIGAAALCLALLIGGWYVFRPVEVECEEILSSDLVQTVTVTGHVVPENSTYVCAPLAGRVVQVFAETGETVEKDAEVVSFDDSEARGDLEDSIASLELQKTEIKKQDSASRAELSVTRKQLEDQLSALRLEYEQLYGENGNAAELYRIAQENFSSANISYWKAYDEYKHSKNPTERAQLSSLEAVRASAEQALLEAEDLQSESAKSDYEDRIASLESQLKLLSGSSGSLAASAEASSGQLDIQIAQLKEKLEKESPNAPFDGIIWEMLVKDGDYVSENQPLYRIYGPEEMEVEVNLLDTQTAFLKVGDPANVELVDGTVLEGELSFLSLVSTEELSVLGVRENRCRALIKVDGMPEQIGAGHQATVEFSVAVRKDVIHVPMSALVSVEDGYGVCTVEHGKARLCPVVTGAQSSGRIEITEGLSEGMTVITNPYDAGVDGGERVKY